MLLRKQNARDLFSWFSTKNYYFDKLYLYFLDNKQIV